MIEPLGTIMSIQNQAFQSKTPYFENKIQQEMTENAFSMQVIDKTTTITNISNTNSLKQYNENNHDKNSFNEKDRKKIKENAQKANKQLKNVGIEFSVHEESNRIEIKIIDKNTDKIIKEIPPEKFLDAYADRMELLGLNFDSSR